MCVCVWTIGRDVKLLSFAGGRGMQLGTTSNEATWLHGMQNLVSAVYLLRFSICMASGQANNRPAFFPMSAQLAQSEIAVKGQLPIYLFRRLTLDPRDWSILCVLLLWSGIIEVLFCTTDAFHNRIRNDSSEQVCYSRRFDKMLWSPRGIPV